MHSRVESRARTTMIKMKNGKWHVYDTYDADSARRRRRSSFPPQRVRVPARSLASHLTTKRNEHRMMMITSTPFATSNKTVSLSICRKSASASENPLNTKKYDVITRCERDGEMVRRRHWRGRFIGGELNTRLMSMSFFEILILIEIGRRRQNHISYLQFFIQLTC